MKKLLALVLLLAAVSLLALLAGYWLASGGLEGIPVISSPEPVPASPPQAPGVEAEEGYRIRLMEEVTSTRGPVTLDDLETRETREWREGAEIVRRPLGGIVLGLVVDGSSSMASPDAAATFAAVKVGVASFLDDLPERLTVTVRSLGGGPDEDPCREGRLLVPVGERAPAPVDGLQASGARNISRSMYRAAGDMAPLRGRKGLVLVTAGEEECGEWPCETARALYGTREGIRTWVVRVQVPGDGTAPAPDEGSSPSAAGAPAESETPAEMQAPVAGEEPAAGTAPPEEAPAGPDAETAPSGEAPATPAAPAPPPPAVPVEAGLECLAGDGGGFVAVASSSIEVDRALRRVAADLSRNVTVRLFRASGRELTGDSDPVLAPWSVAVHQAGDPSRALSTGTLPARFRLEAGRYRLSANYGDAVMEVSSLEVGGAEELEVKMHFQSGQLVVLPGSRPWSTEEEPAGCGPRVSVSRADDPESLPVEKCGLPARFVLPPGDYALEVAGDDGEARLLTVAVARGKETVVRASPGEDPEIIEVDKDRGEN